MDSIHVKIGFNEALEGEKELLLTQVSLIQSIKKISKFRQLRIEEDKINTLIRRELRGISEAVNKIDREMPKKEVPGIKAEVERKVIKEKLSKNLEEELAEINRKLKQLS